MKKNKAQQGDELGQYSAALYMGGRVYALISVSTTNNLLLSIELITQ